MNEDERQIFHIFLGLCSVALVWLLGVQLAAYLTVVLLIFGLVLVHAKLSSMTLGPLESLIERFERPGVTPGYGALTFTAGALAIMTLIADREAILASLLILGVGDAASTIVGRRSRARLPYSRDKTWAGTAAFFAASLPSAYFAGPAAIPVAFLAALAESLESHIDDNLIVSVVCVIGFRLVGLAGI